MYDHFNGLWFLRVTIYTEPQNGHVWSPQSIQYVDDLTKCYTRLNTLFTQTGHTEVNLISTHCQTSIIVSCEMILISFWQCNMSKNVLQNISNQYKNNITFCTSDPYHWNDSILIFWLCHMTLSWLGHMTWLHD